MKKKKRKISRRIKEYILKIKKGRINLEKARADSLKFFTDIFNVDADDIYAEYLTGDFKPWFDLQKAKLIKMIGINDSASDFDCETLYLLVRSLKPAIAVETGVLFGASSSHILAAMQQNNYGRLYSIDLANRNKDAGKDFFVPEYLTDRWELIIGDAKVKLPQLANRLNKIDLFFHDSSHCFEHMIWEYKTALKSLSPKGILSSHDVLSLPFQKNAFRFICQQHNLRNVVLRNIGIALMKG